MPRKRTGQLIWRKSGWYVRYWKMVDGVDVRVSEKLETTNRAVARRKLAKLLASPATVSAASLPDDSLSDFLPEYEEQRKSDGAKGYTDELARLKAYAVPVLGRKPLVSVTTPDINATLDACRKAGKARETIAHLRQDLRNVFGILKRDGTITVNPVDDAVLPKMPDAVRLERAVLTDDELVTYLGWVHPIEKHQMATLERQVMSCVSRMFGGIRTGDLHALDWSAFDTVDGRFSWGYAPRRKTRRPQRLDVPEILRPILRDWWERAGRPTAGLVFPLRRGEKAGKDGRKKSSHAKAFRRDLARSFGLEVWDAEAGEFKDGREPTPRETTLLEGDPYTLPVDFHSWRRAFAQALADADVNAQQAAALTGHASLAAHARYLANSDKAKTVPLAALPRVNVQAAPVPFASEAENENGEKTSRRDRVRTCDIRLVSLENYEKNRESGSTCSNIQDSVFPALPSPSDDPCPFPLPFALTPTAIAADAALEGYLRARANVYLAVLQ
jgi:integrase